MSNKKQTKNNNKVNPMLLAAVGVVVIAAALIIFTPNGNNKPTSNSTTDSLSTTETASTANTDGTKTASAGQTSGSETASTDNQAVLDNNGDVVLNTADVTDQVSFYEYDADGTTVGLLAVKSSDGTIHTALNTCQVCNGSPYAYFEQQGDSIQCQNCGNTFKLDEIGQERGGCNPVPIIDGDRTVSDSQITISAKYLKDNASIFENWKKF
jgi:hypothetical protein